VIGPPTQVASKSSVATSDSQLSTLMRSSDEASMKDPLRDGIDPSTGFGDWEEVAHAVAEGTSLSEVLPHEISRYNVLEKIRQINPWDQGDEGACLHDKRAYDQIIRSRAMAITKKDVAETKTEEGIFVNDSDNELTSFNRRKISKSKRQRQRDD